MLAAGSPLMVEDLAGGSVDLRDGLAVSARDEARMTLLAFWGTWCQPCIEEIPVLNEMKRFYGSQGLRVLGVALDMGGESKESLSAAIGRHGINYPILFDAKGEARRRFGLSALPSAALVDGSGKVVWVGRGLPTDLSSRIRSGLAPGGAGAAK